jgi:two-component system, chemotaxis family, protein-glutamate methylesterase/glutaminase
MTMAPNRYQIVVIGGSAGAMAALTELLQVLPPDYPLPIVVVQHLHPLQDGYYLGVLNKQCALTVKEAEEKEPIKMGHIYFAPPNYHLLIEDDRTFSLSIDAKVNYARPSIDVLFESAVHVYGSKVAAIILTGANNDGAQGIKLAKARGGLAIVQDPKTASSPYMPKAALEAMQADHVLPPKEIGRLLIKIIQ